MQISSCYFPDLDSLVTTCCFLDESSKSNLGNKALLDLITAYSLTSTLCSSCPKLFAIPGLILHFLASRTSPMLFFCSGILFSITPSCPSGFSLDVTSFEKAFCSTPSPTLRVLVCLWCLKRATHCIVSGPLYMLLPLPLSLPSLLPVAVYSR